MRRLNKISLLGVTCIGLLLGGAQVLLLRQSLSLAGSDEVVFALVLALWLLMVAAGSTLGASLLSYIRDTSRVFGAGLLALSLTVPTALVLLPWAVSWTEMVPGTLPGAGGLVPALCLALLPLGLVGGSLFPLACRLLTSTSDHPVNLAYLLEAIGFFLAGTGLSLIFAPHLSNLMLASCLALPGIGLGLRLALPHTKLIVIISSLVILALGLLFVPSLESALASHLRPGVEILETLQTPYGLIEVTRHTGQLAVYENRLLLAVNDDPAAAEERAHLCLAQHPRPQRVLWIGGSLGGSLTQALRHPSLERLDLVEINPALKDVTRWFEADAASQRDQRVSFHLEDGRHFMAQAKSSTYDIIALNLPGPRSARLSKYYTVEGFRLAAKALKPGGILVFTIESSEDYIGSDLGLLLASLRTTLLQVFPRVSVLPGGQAIFVAGDASAQMADNPQILIFRLDQAGIKPIYWDQYRLEDRLSPARINKLRQTLNGFQSVPVNRDVAPVSFYFNQVVWSRQVQWGGAGLLKTVRGVFLPAGLILMAVVIIAALFIRLRFRRSGRQIGAAWGVTTVGMTGISLEILALIGYQVQFGSGYREVGLLLGLYMAGLALGARVAMRLAGQAKRYFPIVQGHWILAAGALIPLVAWGSLWGEMPLLYRGLFALYMIVLGVLGGVHFPLALEFGGSVHDRGAGRYYALDLAGAAAGALVFGLIALPLGGMTVCAAALAILNAVAAGLLLKAVSPSPV